jgi:hypothetical protein
LFNSLSLCTKACHCTCFCLLSAIIPQSSLQIVNCKLVTMHNYVYCLLCPNAYLRVGYPSASEFGRGGTFFWQSSLIMVTVHQSLVPKSKCSIHLGDLQVILCVTHMSILLVSLPEYFAVILVLVYRRTGRREVTFLEPLQSPNDIMVSERHISIINS